MDRETKKAIMIVTTIKMVVGYAIAIMLAYCLFKGILMAICPKEITTTVVDCVAVGECYEVTVETESGERWSYYDDDYRAIGDTLNVSFNGNELVDIGEN